MTMRETRAVAFDQAEVRKADDGEGLTFTGHAAVFNERTWIGPKRWGFYEEIDPGFFDDVLNDRAAFLVNHDPNIVLARNGTTMSLSVDKRGLVPEAQWDPQDPDAQKWARRVDRGDVNEMSFAFTVDDEDPRSVRWGETDDGAAEVRTLLRATGLYDVSLVTYPAYQGTDGGMRDQAAEVVKRHRGVDPRDAERLEADRARRRSAESVEPVAVPAVEAEAVAETDLVEVPTAAEVVESADGPTVPVEETPAARSLLAMRHRANAIRFGFKRDLINVGPLNGILDGASQGGGAAGGDDDEGEDEDFSTDAGFVTEVIENAQDTVAAAVEYLAESDPATRNAAVVTLAQNLIRDLNKQVTTISAYLT